MTGSSVFCFFFFFQAEDGIRDLTVTGVQTCALPIFRLIGGRFQQGRVELFQRGEQRQHHEGQIGVDDAEVHGEAGAHDAQWVTDQSEVQQRRVEKAGIADDALERVHAQQERCPERQHDDEQQQPLRGLRAARDGVGHGVAEGQADQSREERGAQRVQVGDPVHLVGEQVAVVAEGQGELQVVLAREGDDVGKGRHARRGLGEADFEGEGERNEKEYEQEDQRRQNDEPAARTPGRFHDARFEYASGVLCGINFAPVHLSTGRRLPPPVARLKHSPVEALRLLVNRYLDADIASPRKVSVWYAFWGEASARQEYQDICGQKDEEFAALVRELMERLIAASAATHLDADGVALGLIGVLEVLW